MIERSGNSLDLRKELFDWEGQQGIYGCNMDVLEIAPVKDLCLENYR